MHLESLTLQLLDRPDMGNTTRAVTKSYSARKIFMLSDMLCGV